MNIRDKIEKLENKFDNFVHDFYNELKDLKEKAKEEHPTAYERVRKIICDAESMNREIIKITISEDIETELRHSFPVGHINYYGITTCMGIPVEVDRTCYNTITVIIKQ